MGSARQSISSAVAHKRSHFQKLHKPMILHLQCHGGRLEVRRYLTHRFFRRAWHLRRGDLSTHFKPQITTSFHYRHASTPALSSEALKRLEPDLGFITYNNNSSPRYRHADHQPSRFGHLGLLSHRGQRLVQQAVGSSVHGAGRRGHLHVSESVSRRILVTPPVVLTRTQQLGGRMLPLPHRSQ